MSEDPTDPNNPGVIDQSFRPRVQGGLVLVERKPTKTDAFFIAEGQYTVITANGESQCTGPVWILWDTAGYPYPITPDEFDRLYTQKTHK